MTNINVKVVGTANLGSMHKEFSQLNAEVAALNAQLAKTIDTSQAVDASGYQKLARAASYNSKIFRDAAASTGLFETQQVRLNSATDEYVKRLKAQKVGFRDMIRQQKIARAAYKEQLAMESMLVRRGPSSNATGKEVFDVVTPKRYAAELDNAGNRMAWFNEHLKSGATQMVNWGKNTQWAGRQLMVGFTIPVAAFGAAAGVMAYQVDAAMTRVRKVYDTTADSTSADIKDITAVNKELQQVTEAGIKTAMDAAAAYGQAGTDTITVMGDLAATGKAGAELQKDTLEVMRIARLGEVENQIATDATIALQSVFRDTITTSEDLADAFNYMNAVENATSLSTADFAQAIPVAASAVKAWGGDVKELGILLTAMRENGIGASEGANAIKATMQRLARPSKQVREEWSKLTNTDILGITENAESLTDVFTQIFHATKDLSDADQRKAFAGLFGSYQVSKMMALTKGMGELEQGIGQVSDAYRIAGMDAQEWETIASNEVKQYQESISGQFKIALEEVKLQLATLGEPFVVLATKALGAVSNIIELFNQLPGAVKTGVAGLVGLAAIAGPLVMLAGLLGNLVGNAGKAAAALVGVFTKAAGAMGVLDKQGRIYLKVAEAQQSEERRLADATNTLAIELVKLAEAQLAANKATEAATTISARASAAYQAQMAAAAEARALQQAMAPDLYRDADDPLTGAPVVYHGTKEGQRFTKEEAEARGRARLAQEQADIAKETAESNERNAKASEKTKRSMTGAAVAGNAMAAGLALSMTTSEGTAHNIGNMLMMGSIVAPAAWMFAKGMAAAVKWISIANIQAKALAASTKVAAMYTAIGAAAAGRYAMGLTAAGAAFAKGGGILRTGAAFLTGALGPLGLVTTAVVGIGAGIWLWKKHLEKVRQEQYELHHNINTMAEEWASQMGLVEKKYKAIAQYGEDIEEKGKFQTYLDAYKSGDMKDNLAAFDSDDLDEQTRYEYAADQFVTLQRDFGMSAKDAALSINAMYQAAGRGALEAEIATQQLLETIGTVNAEAALAIQADSFFNTEAGSKEAEEAGEDVGKAFAQGLQETNNDASARLMEAFGSIVNDGYGAAISELQDNRDFGQPILDKFAELGIGSASAMREAITRAGGTENLIDQMFPDLDPAERSSLFDALEGATRDARAAEQAMVAGIVDQLNLSEDIDSLYELQNTIEGVVATAGTLPYDEVQKFYDALTTPSMNPIMGLAQGFSMVQIQMSNASEKQRLMYFNAMLTARGFKEVETYAEAVAIASGTISPKIDEAAAAARRLGNAFQFTLSNINQIDFQGAMNNVQQQIADDYSSAMNDSLDADLAATQNYWDQKVDAAGNAGEAARARLDAAWEKRNAAAEKYWDHRIELVEKSIEIEQDAEEKRQKMFDAEIARIQKLNDMANANIDFNVALNEGKLDEAAKLRNDLQADSDTTAIERARDKLAQQSENRIARLEKKRDRLEKKRDAVMEAMQKREDQQKAHLDRMTQANQAAVEAQRDAAVKAKEEEIAAQKELLAESIEVFMSGTAAEKSEMKKRMEQAGLSYKWFQEHVIEPKGLKWGEYFGQMMQTELKKSADKIRSDQMWEDMGKSALEKMAKGMGFSSIRSLIHFLNTGEMKDFNDTAAGTPTLGKDPSNGGKTPETRHEGGWVGRGGASRKGVARTQKNNSPEERTLRAKVGEFVVNAKSAAMNRKSLEAINSGKFGADSGPFGTGGMSKGQGPVPFFAAGFTRGMALRTASNMGTYTKGFRAGLMNDLGPGSSQFPGAGFVQGGGGRHRPVMGGVITNGIHPDNAIDIGVPSGTPVYAVADGRISSSYDIPGYEPRQPDGGNGYRSYGRVITIDHGGFSTLYAHLSSRSAAAGQVVKGGARIGLSGDTGNSSGDHLHFGAPGANPYSFMSLRKGAQNIRFDNTLANLHKNEAVLTEDINRQFKQGVERFAEGPGNDYTVIVNPSRGMDEEMLANKVVRKVKQLEKRKPQTRTVGKN